MEYPLASVQSYKSRKFSGTRYGTPAVTPHRPTIDNCFMF
jgi:hypothetical protein